MNALDSRIRELVTYARERDGEDRTTLFRSLVDMFLTGKAPAKEPTRGQLLDVLEALVPHVEPDARRTVSEILASMTKPPMDLVLRLAHDRAKLVEEILKTAPFDEDEIIELVSATGRDHHQILAGRSDLSANVWIALARAAPSAPPFEGQSTLALWRDDLGSQKDEDIVDERIAAVGGGGGGLRDARPATVTPLHITSSGEETDETKTASLRILRTDEDLISERVNGHTPEPETKMVNDGDKPTTPAPVDMVDLTSTDTVPPQSSSPLNVSNIIPSVEAPPLKDPGPGGWAWRSDRDGFVTNISPHAARLFGGSDRLVGAAMLDMLGLNTKLGHPVSRAFQRRSTIHDAPIGLTTLPQGHQYWTLEAAPVFSPCGGVFEGYEGVLTPVVGIDSISAHDGIEAPLFLDDDDLDAESDRPSFADLSNKSGLPFGLERSDTTGPDQDIQDNSDPAPDNSSIADMINSTAAAMVRDAVADALSPLSPSQEAERYGEMTDDMQQRPSVSDHTASKPSLIAEEVAPELQSTLSLLEEALDRLADAAQTGTETQIQLQSEIAQACVRTLRSQLKRRI